MINLIGTRWLSSCGSFRYTVCSVVEQDEEEKFVLSIECLATHAVQRGCTFMTFDELTTNCTFEEIR